MTEALPRAADPEHLTEALRRGGALRDGRVREAAVESSRRTVLSQIVRLRLAYEGAAGDAPGSVILKVPLPDRAGSGRHEVAFYTEIAGSTPGRLIPRCFEAARNADAGEWHLLLEDLTETHIIATTWPLPPTAGQCESIVATLARFHAAWWDDPRLGASIGTWQTAETNAAFIQRLAGQLAGLADRVGDLLTPERRSLYERLIEAAPRLFRRYEARRNLTVVHGDAHIWNCLLPRDEASDGVRLFDRDSWRIDTGSDDLAYMLAMHWYPDRRRRLERALLDRYYATLLAHGVSGYDRRALDDDYRLSVLWQITTPVWQATNGIPPVIWWNNFERIHLAVDDLACRDLLA